MAILPNNVYQGDCIRKLNEMEPGSVDLVFADPPFNIGYDYDVYDDQRSGNEYLQFSRDWMSAVSRVLTPAGTFWLAIGDEYAAELKIEAQKVGFHCRSWVIWYYTFGVNCANGFSRSHTHLFHFVKDPKDFTFNRPNPQIRVKSARGLVYADNRANPNGRLPDNTWIIRPQDTPLSFSPIHDTWYFARVAGTFKEREGFHGCQMPEQLLGRIVRCCSNPLDVVLDPFGGSGTTLTVAKKLGRRFVGFELSADYANRIKRRLAAAEVGDELDGPEDPLRSAPTTKDGKRVGGTKTAVGRRSRATWPGRDGRGARPDRRSESGSRGRWPVATAPSGGRRRRYPRRRAPRPGSGRAPEAFPYRAAGGSVRSGLRSAAGCVRSRRVPRSSAAPAPRILRERP